MKVFQVGKYIRIGKFQTPRIFFKKQTWAIWKFRIVFRNWDNYSIKVKRYF